MAKSKFRPLHDRVVVKRIDAEEKTKGGIIIPDTAKEKPSQGEITAVGPGGRDEAGKLIPIDLKVGDRVLFGKWSGTEVKLDGEELLIMKESDIMGVLSLRHARPSRLRQARRSVPCPELCRGATLTLPSDALPSHASAMSERTDAAATDRSISRSNSNGCQRR